MATKHHIVFSVTGTGYFPMDMLRYDNCVPNTTESAELIRCPPFEPGKMQASRTVKLFIETPDRTRRPTRDRWSSFGWTVGTVIVDGK